MKRGLLTLAMLLVGAGLLAASSLGGERGPAGGSFKVAYTTDIDYVDPALAYYRPSWVLEYATGAMLFSYPDAPSPRGSRLIPEVAVGFPTISRDGRTYTFRLKKTYRFSNGQPVTAANFAWALNRTLNRGMNSPAQPFLMDIAGAADVVTGRTERASGLRVLDSHTLRVRLEVRAADLLARLALPFFAAIPTDLPIEPLGVGTPLVSAGPYFFERWERNRRIVLRRNRFYRGPRPHNVDSIVVHIGLPLETIKLSIDRGETDWGELPPSAHAELGARYGVRRRSPGRYFVNPAATILYLSMNHERNLFKGKTPFGNLPLKKAVNHAIDRTAMLNQQGAYAGVVHDQLLPPTIRGFRDVELYPRRPNLPRARRLAAGHLHGGRGILYCSTRRPAGAVCQVAQANLREIGLSLDIVGPCRNFCLDPGARPHYDLALEAWRADYFDPYDFLFLVNGSTIQPANNANWSYFNSPRYNRRIDQANALVGPARYRAFATLDHDVMRTAAPVAVYGVANERHYVSARTGCYHNQPVYGFDLAAICLAR